MATLFKNTFGTAIHFAKPFLFSPIRGRKDFLFLPRFDLRATFSTTPAPHVHRSMARRPRAAAAASPASTQKIIDGAIGHGTGHQVDEKLRALLRVVLVQASALRRLLSRLRGERRNEHAQKNTFAATSGPRVYRFIARWLQAAASASFVFNPSTIVDANGHGKATESTRKIRAPLRVVLFQASVFCRLLSH